MYKKIVVGTDLSETSRVAVDHAASLAQKLDAELVLLYAGNHPGESLDAWGKEVGAEVVATPGPPAEVLVAEAERLGADLLVVGSVGMSGARRFMLGNVPNKVSHHATTDLLIVKTDGARKRTGDYAKILVGTDGSGTAMRAVEMASELAKSLSVKPVIVTAFDPPSEHELEQLRSGTGDAVHQWSATREQRSTPEGFQWRLASAAQAEDVLERAEQCAAEKGVEAEVRSVEGAPADRLLEIAEDENFDLIAVGSVGMAGSKRFMLGNVPHRLSHHTPTDILILHTV
ncbi:MAG TPA: universal stress protein [Actinomycetota bacterium]|nr:universal stress protein [Actinomycetota bacterium]